MGRVHLVQVYDTLENTAWARRQWVTLYRCEDLAKALELQRTVRGETRVFTFEDGGHHGTSKS